MFSYPMYMLMYIEITFAADGFDTQRERERDPITVGAELELLSKIKIKQLNNPVDANSK